jgi:hypothetical protein
MTDPLSGDPKFYANGSAFHLQASLRRSMLELLLFLQQ